jgi:rRNA maturation protein Rpf1
LKDKSLVRDPTKIAGLRKSNPKNEKILFDLIKEMLSKWIANEGPNGGIKGVIKNNFQPVFADELEKTSDEYKE